MYLFTEQQTMTMNDLLFIIQMDVETILKKR